MKDALRRVYYWWAHASKMHYNEDTVDVSEPDEHGFIQTVCPKCGRRFVRPALCSEVK